MIRGEKKQKKINFGSVDWGSREPGSLEICKPIDAVPAGSNLLDAIRWLLDAVHLMPFYWMPST